MEIPLQLTNLDNNLHEAPMSIKTSNAQKNMPLLQIPVVHFNMGLFMIGSLSASGNN